MYDVLVVSGLSSSRRLIADRTDRGMLLINARLGFCVFSRLTLFFFMITVAMQDCTLTDVSFNVLLRGFFFFFVAVACLFDRTLMRRQSDFRYTLLFGLVRFSFLMTS